MMEDMCEAKGMDSMFEQMACEAPEGPNADELKASFQSFMKASMGKGDEDGMYTLPDGSKAKMDPGMAGMMGGPFGADGKENFEAMMKEMSEMEANGEPIDEEKLAEMMGGMGMGGMGGMGGMDGLLGGLGGMGGMGDPEEMAAMMQCAAQACVAESAAG